MWHLKETTFVCETWCRARIICSYWVKVTKSTIGFLAKSTSRSKTHSKYQSDTHSLCQQEFNSLITLNVWVAHRWTDWKHDTVQIVGLYKMLKKGLKPKLSKPKAHYIIATQAILG